MEFLNLKKGKMTVVEYNTKFMEWCCYAPHVVSTESRKARKFKAGLRWNIQNKVDILRLPTHQEVLQRATIAGRSCLNSGRTIGKCQEGILAKDKVRKGKIPDLRVEIH